ncbi:DUF2057 family protein [Pseudoalteromonas sp. PS5]|uniref:DUF2057 family protein n=1 Tax=Pseudoalteromonas sp. PS5 TaxID=1437473 RepID=UPI000FFE5D6E|nr:DUF2057 family protein [Pseudoalteromonas sp. PS5]RXF02524.1 DUF2057 domain-containing protein [Pseudoalteromonas sp. PS5]
MRLKSTLVTAGLFLSSFSHAALLSFPEEIIPLQVNDKTIEHSFFSKVRELDLASGEYVVKMRYTDLYEVGYDDHETVESKPFWATISIDTDGQYDVKFNRPDNVVAAKAFAAQPLIMLQAPNESLATTLVVTQKRPRVVSAIASQSAEVTAPRYSTPSNPTQPAAPAAPKSAHPDVVGMLDYWWQQATPEQKQLFLEKIKGN